MKVKIINSDVYCNGEILQENKVYDVDEKHLNGLINFYEPLNSDNMIQTIDDNSQPVKRGRGRPRKNNVNE